MLTVDADIVDIDESLTLKQTKISSYWSEFQKIMKREFDSLIENEIWDLTFTLFSQSILIDRWVFKIKKDRWSNILKFKTRWVVHEFKQKKELDFIDIFVFVVKSMFWKVMMTVFAKRDYRIRQMNVIIAFLYEFLDEKMYVRQSTHMKDEISKVCLLKKTLYDLKQFSHVWYQTLQDFLQKLSFKRIETNHDFFVSIDKFIFRRENGKSAPGPQNSRWLGAGSRASDLAPAMPRAGLERANQPIYRPLRPPLLPKLLKKTY